MYFITVVRSVMHGGKPLRCFSDFKCEKHGAGAQLSQPQPANSG